MLIKKYNEELKINTTIDASGKKSNCHDILNNINVVGVLFNNKLVFEDDAIKKDFFDKNRIYNSSNVDEIFIDKLSRSFRFRLDKLEKLDGKRKDFYLIQNKNLYLFNNDYKYENTFKNIYLSLNEKIKKNTNPDYQRLFSLLRLKYNFVIFYKRNEKYGILNVPAELIDISIATLDDDDMKYVYKNVTYHINKYTFDKYLKLDYYGYSITGYIDDILNALFNESNSPWIDPKYTKKISRISYYLMIYILSSNKTIDIKIKILDDLINIYTIPYNRNNLININQLIDNMKSTYSEDDLLQNFLNNIQKIYIKDNKIYETSIIKHLDITQYIIDNIELYNELSQTMIKYLNINKIIINKYKKINIESYVPQLGGYYNKYLKYKNKYLELKNIIN
jgi:hypothetical protein